MKTPLGMSHTEVNCIKQNKKTTFISPKCVSSYRGGGGGGGGRRLLTRTTCD